MTRDERRTTSDQGRTTNDERRTTNDERRTTNDRAASRRDQRPWITQPPDGTRDRRRVTDDRSSGAEHAIWRSIPVGRNIAQHSRGTQHGAVFPWDATRSTEHATRNTEHGTRNTQHGTRNTQHAARNTQHAARNTEHATRNTQHAARNTQHATRNTQHAARNTQHATRGTEPASPRLAIVIVNYNVREMLRSCLAATYASLARSPGLDAAVWVVDNASSDGSAEMVAAEYPQACLIASSANLGFAGGNNLVLRELGFGGSGRERHGDPVLLLNPDSEPAGDAIGQMARFLVEHPAAGGAGAQLAYGDGRFQHGAFRFPDLWQLWFDLFLPRPRRLLESRLNGRYPRALYAAGHPFPVDFALGAALMVRGEAIDAVGLLDEGYFMYAEEVDWCWRMGEAGFPIYCVPAACVVHHGGGSTQQYRVQSFLDKWRSRRRLYGRFYGPTRRWLAARIVQLGMRAEVRRLQAAAARGEITAGELDQRVAAARQVEALFSGKV